MSYEISEFVERLNEVYDFLDEVQPVLSLLEDSSGVVLVQYVAFPAEAIGLRVEPHGGAFLISYNMELFGLLKLVGAEVDTPVLRSLQRYLSNVEPSSKSAFIETALYSLVLNEAV